MAKLTQKQIANRLAKVSDETLPLSDRKVAYVETMNEFLNPKADVDFDPATFDPMDGVKDYEVKKRNRTEPPRRLPTMGMKPKELFTGQLVGMFESKQDLYLLIAWLSERVSDLEDQLKVQKGG